MAERKTRKLSFPKNFLWGASISTHQAEGNNHNQWTTWELETAQVKVAQAPYNYDQLDVWSDLKAQMLNPQNYVSGRTTNHYKLYKLDFDIAQELNCNALRTGIEWSRIEPKEGEFNKKEVLHYKKYFSELKKRGITPVITLWHWTFPNWFAQKGGFEKRRNVKYFTRYVRYISEQLGADFDHVITINEPTIYTTMSYHENRWPPQKNSKLLTLYVLLNLAKAHKASYKIIKKIRPRTKVGLAHQCAYFYAGDDSIISKLSAWAAHRWGNEFFINRVKKQQDFLGLNYYFANQIFGTRVHNSDNNALNDLGWDMQPDKLRPLMNQLYEKYKLPIIVTENGVADHKDQYRKWWIGQSVKALDGALQDGTPVKGYIHWSLLDNFEWAEGFWPRFGLVEVNYKTMSRKVRPSALWYSKLIKSLQK